MIENIITYSSVLSPVVGIFVGIQLRKSLSQGQRYILWMMALSFASDIIMLLLATTGTKNLPVAHLYGLLEGTLLLLFFRTELPRHATLIKYLRWIYTGLYLTDSLFISGLYQFNAYSRSLEALIIMIVSMLYFYKIYETESDIFFDKAPGFWIVVGLLVYFSGALFSFLLSTEILSQSPDRFYGSWILHNVSNTIKNIILTVALWKVRSNSIQR